MIKTVIFGNDKKYVVESNNNDYDNDLYSLKSVSIIISNIFNNDLKSSKKLLQYCGKDIKHKNDCQKLKQIYKLNQIETSLLHSDRFIIYYRLSIFFIDECRFILFSWYCVSVCLRYYNYGGNDNNTTISDATESVNFCVQLEGHVTLLEIFFINMDDILSSILVGYVIYEKEKIHCHTSLELSNENIQYSKRLQTYLHKQFGTVGSPVMSFH